MIDVTKVQEEAAKELAEEQVASAKSKIKSKLRNIAQTKKLLRQLEMELEDIYARIAE